MTASSPGTSRSARRLVVVGGGMVAHRLVTALADRDGLGSWQVDLFTEEPHAPYDRVALTSYFSGRTPEDLVLEPTAVWDAPGVRLHTSTEVTAVHPQEQVVDVDGRQVSYDALVLATGSAPFVPPVAGSDLPGAFVYRTVDDVQALEAWVQDRGGVLRGAVVGGGLLGWRRPAPWRSWGSPPPWWSSPTA